VLFGRARLEAARKADRTFLARKIALEFCDKHGLSTELVVELAERIEAAINEAMRKK
jgi:alanyl-tRNA synthetase